MSEVDHQISAQTVADYCEAYAFLDPADLDPALIGQHWNLERRLAAELQASTPEDRADTFEAAYSALYDVLKWHDQVPNARQSTPHEAWEAAIGEPPQTIYEIGAGHGLLLHHLASRSHLSRDRDHPASWRGQLLPPPPDLVGSHRRCPSRPVRATGFVRRRHHQPGGRAPASGRPG